MNMQVEKEGYKVLQICISEVDLEKDLAWIESVCTFSHGLNYCLMFSILLTRQSNNLFMHFFNTLKQLRRSSGTAPA